MEDKILEIKEVKKSYRKREVLHNTNFVLKTYSGSVVKTKI